MGPSGTACAEKQHQLAIAQDKQAAARGMPEEEVAQGGTHHAQTVEVQSASKPMGPMLMTAVSLSQKRTAEHK